MDREDLAGQTAPIATAPGGRRAGWWSVLLWVQFIAVLWPPFFNRIEPRWLGIPFFYWYQLLWVILGAAGTTLVYRVTRE